MLLALSSGVALALAYPSFNIPLLGWVAPAILIVAVLGERPLAAFFLGWLQGAVYFGLSLPWFYTVMRQYGPLPVIQAGAVFALVVVILSSFHAAFAAAIAWLGKSAPRRACVAAPFLWVAMEFATMHMPAIGFPWNLLGYVAAGNLAFVQLTAVTGIFGLSFVVASYNALAAWVVVQMSQRKQGGMAMWVAANGALMRRSHCRPSLCSAGACRSHRASGANEFSRVQRISARIGCRSHAAEMDQLEQISICGGAKSSRRRGVAGSSSAVFAAGREFSISRNAHRARRGKRLFGRRNRLEAAARRRRSPRTTAPCCSGANGAVDFIYDKIHLVPFSEYVPWRNWFFFARDLTGLIGDFQHGSQYKVGNISGGPFSAFICYEAIFPNEIRRFTLAGAQLFINISDDGWFGGSALRRSIWRWRACEPWKIAAGCCAIPTMESPFPSIPTGASQRNCPRTFAANWTRHTRFART